MNRNPNYTKTDLQDHMGICLWIENRNNEILMQYHKKFECWTIPLEKSEIGETLKEAIIRTGEEELGIDIKQYEVVHNEKKEYLRKDLQIFVDYYIVKVTKYYGVPENREPEKHSDFGWKTKTFLLNQTDSTDGLKMLQRIL